MMAYCMHCSKLTFFTYTSWTFVSELTQCFFNNYRIHYLKLAKFNESYIDGHLECCKSFYYNVIKHIPINIFIAYLGISVTNSPK